MWHQPPTNGWSPRPRRAPHEANRPRNRGHFTGVLTKDGGSTWQAYTVPSAAILSLATVGGSTYAILNFDSGNGSSFSLAMSQDGMRTWQPISLPYGSDGAALATMSSNLYRMAPGATRWQSLGALPPSAESITYASTPSRGILWAFPAESDGASGAGPANAVYSAPYPVG